ncbi:hypothetical protein [Pinibacter aurantiacus]|uniref:Uncharacterized protein n=1 Tax=Pinibacter aurantiacus TaxID=2851599 RepID=A0A9E2W328_9BACT|nr:hypothetical protein [Pinibacter aurantiacus]MBV4355773.1 hypothetical protein [Pinibacter aurantiacus]
MTNEKDIPEQTKGSSKDIQEVAHCKTADEAQWLFNQGRYKLLNVNNWNEWCGNDGADFCLMDETGEHLEGVANEGDFIRIDIPGPGSNEGSGYDWVKIVDIKDREGIFTMTVKPASDPNAETEDTAHFFDKDASSTFEVSLHDNDVLAAVHGRNEKPNTEVQNFFDKIRNFIVGKTAIAGFANLQWSRLVKGVLDKD